MDETQKKVKKLKLVTELKSDSEVALLKHIDSIEEELKQSDKNIVTELDQKLETKIQEVKNSFPTFEEVLEAIEIPEPIKGDSGEKGEDGKDYILTDEDKMEIAMAIDVPIVEKIIEKTEVIRETPTVTEKIIEKAIYEEPNQIISKINIATNLIDSNKVKGFSDLERLSKLNAFNPTMGPSFSDLARLQRQIDANTGGSTLPVGSPYQVLQQDTSTPTYAMTNILYDVSGNKSVDYWSRILYKGWAINQTVFPTQPSAVFLGTFLDDLTLVSAGSPYNSPSPDDIIIFIDNLQLTISGASGPFQPGETVTSNTGGSGTVYQDNNPALLLNFVGIAFAPGIQIITGGTSGNTATVTAIVDTFKLLLNNIPQIGGIPIQTTPYTWGALKFQWANLTGHAINDTWEILMVEVNDFTIQDASGNQILNVGDDGTTFIKNDAGTQFLSINGLNGNSYFGQSTAGNIFSSVTGSTLDLRYGSTSVARIDATRFTVLRGYARHVTNYSPLTGGIIVMASTDTDIMISPAGTIATLTLTFPANPVNGQYWTAETTQQITALTMSAPGKTITNALTSMGAGASVSYMYSVVGNRWYQLSQNSNALALTDVTTNDTSTTKHGFYPKLTANTTPYVNNLGTLTQLALGAVNTVFTSTGALTPPAWTSLNSLAVTSIASSDSSLTFTSSVGVVDGKLNVAHANTWTALQTFAPTATSSGSSNSLIVTQGANTNQTASTEAVSVNMNLSSTIQFAGSVSPISQQRAFLIQAPTYTGSSAALITGAGSLVITGAPIASTFMTITNSWGLWLQAGTFHLGAQTGYTQFSAGGTGGEVNDSNNTTAGHSIIVHNLNNGASAYSGVDVDNDVTLSLLTYSGIFLTSSNYTDTSFGTAFAVKNQFQVTTTAGPMIIGTSATSSFMNIIIGGSAIANEVGRFTTTGLTLGLTGTLTGQLTIKGATSGAAILTTTTVAGTPTITLPNASTTLAGLSIAQTFSGVQGFNNDIKVLTAGKTLFIKTGANSKIGQGTLVGGTATISTTAVTANSIIILTDTGGGLNIGSIYVSAQTVGTSFVVTSLNALDTSTFNWVIFEMA